MPEQNAKPVQLQLLAVPPPPSKGTFLDAAEVRAGLKAAGARIAKAQRSCALARRSFSRARLAGLPTATAEEELRRAEARLAAVKREAEPAVREARALPW